MEDWRKIDIDALEPNSHMSREELVPDLPPVSLEQVESISKQCKSTLSSGRFAEALALALDTPPYVADERTKEIHAATVFEILCSIKNNHSAKDISGFIQQLNSEQQDALVKYLYKTMSTGYGAKQGGLLLQWFEKTVEVTGIGAIVRYMSDRRTV